jgi:hypothetical protein
MKAKAENVRSFSSAQVPVLKQRDARGDNSGDCELFLPKPMLLNMLQTAAGVEQNANFWS